ncbi:MAG: class I poly(R)-hydroxyalkanoic acid synthase [Candidatus Competibacterales bacterium]|nr:class I poly(R)-hydroxyalkanoic acid synthase [Candidatus Competibacterales bacterium]
MTSNTTPDPVAMSRTLATIAEKSQRLVSDFLQHQVSDGALGMTDTQAISRAFMDMTQRLMTNPTQLVEAQLAFWQGHMDLWQRSAASWLGQQPGEPAVAPERSDRRFRHEDWQQNFVFDYIKQSYLLTARWLQSTVGRIEGLDERSRRKLDFYTRQFVDALSPSNFPATNPEVLRATLDTGGGNLLKGLQHLLEDLERGKGRLSIRQTDLEAFQPGVNVAITPGKVIYQNDLMQLLQYVPTTEEVYRRPLIVVPPWINKFYILDLREQNSFIKWWVDQGFTVFVISWVNPDTRLAEKNFEDYLREGTLAALEAVEQATGEREVNMAGYCLGGTLLACTAGYLAARGDDRLQSCTFFATMLDFECPGELEVFIDEEELTALERRMREKGYLEGSEMATTFNMLRANDLIWSFFVNNYLLGKEPFPFDLLYWNSDSTRMPAAMHSFYLRNMYQQNLLKEPGGITLLGKPIDLTRITQPIYSVAAVDDHIAPWTSVYSGARLFASPVRFVLGGSGHIAGIVNPPAAGKYHYWTHDTLSEDPETWFRAAERHDGSWWADWHAWVEPLSGDKVAARTPGDGRLKPIEDAPGSYVRQRIDS